MGRPRIMMADTGLEVEMKRCPKCMQWKPGTQEYWPHNKRLKGNLHTYCRVCTNLMNAEAYRKKCGADHKVGSKKYNPRMETAALLTLKKIFDPQLLPAGYKACTEGLCRRILPSYDPSFWPTQNGECVYCFIEKQSKMTLGGESNPMGDKYRVSKPDPSDILYQTLSEEEMAKLQAQIDWVSY
jgi:hypothetical protein